MSLISFQFYILVAVMLAVYYILPLNFRWVTLLVGTGVFVWYANRPKLVLVVLVQMVFSYFIGRLIDSLIKSENQKFAKFVAIVGVVSNSVILLILKDINFFTITGRCIQRLFRRPATIENISITASLGISYYTLSLIAYVLDVYWGTTKAEKNIFKFLAYAGYMPLLTSGPIVRKNEVYNKIILGNRLDYVGFCMGLQRIVWGMFKKLVVSERAAVIVNTVYDDYSTYSGLYIIVAVILFVIQLYTDFSGCIDIALGVSELFGIKLPENFNLPFISCSIAELWRRWHMTLGGWLRDYVMYPLLKSRLFQGIGDKSKRLFGKKIGKKIPTWIATIIVYFISGLWHGGAWNYIVNLAFFGVVIVLEEMLQPLANKVNTLLRINTKCTSWKMWQMLRTFILFAIGESFFRAYNGVREGIEIWKNALTVWNPWILFDGSLNNLGLDAKDWGVLKVSLLVVVLAGLFRYYVKCPIREWLADQNTVFRWIVLYVAVFGVVIFGCYGVGYDATTFIYQQF